MIIAIDFDGTLVGQDHPYDDLVSPLRLLPFAREALAQLKEAGHILVLWSARSNLALRWDWRHNPLWAMGIVPFDEEHWKEQQPLNQARFQQMIEFVERELPGVFDCIDYGNQGKFTGIDLFIDDKALRAGDGAKAANWYYIANVYGANIVEEDDAERDSQEASVRGSLGGAVPLRPRLPERR